MTARVTGESIPWLDAEAVAGLLPMGDAVAALGSALAAGLDPGADPARGVVDTAHGQLLLMPAEVGASVGVKAVTVAPGNPDHGLPRIQAVYVLFDGRTLAPVALLDGTALTSLRTPATSAVAVRQLATVNAARVVVFGTGPQAWGHLEALRTVRPLRQATVVARDPGRTADFVRRVAESGLPATVGGPESVADADIVVCATTAAEPLFDGALVPDSACVVAIGSHERHARELDAALLARSTVVVEDRATALREAGDVVLAVAERALDPATLVTLAELVRDHATDPARPRVFKSVGMAWQDLVVAAEVWRRRTAGTDVTADGSR